MLKKVFFLAALISHLAVASPAQADEPAILGLGRVTSLALSPDGGRLAVASTVGVYFYDAPTFTPAGAWPTGYAVYRLAWSPRGDVLALRGDRRMEVRALDDGAVLWSTHSSRARIESMSFSHDGARLALTRDGALEVYEVASGALVKSLAGDYWGVAFSPDGGRLAACCRRGSRAQILDAATLQVEADLSAGGNLLEWNSAGTQLAMIWATGWWGSMTIAVWDVPGNRLLAEVPAGDLLTSLAFSPDGKWLAAGSGTVGFVQVWATDRWGPAQTTLRGHYAWAGGVSWAPDSQTLYSAGSGTVRAWDMATGRQSRLIDGFGYPVYQVTWSADGQRVIAQQGGHLASTDVASRQPASAAFLDREPLYCYTFPDGAKYMDRVESFDCTMRRRRGYSRASDFATSPRGDLVAKISDGFWIWRTRHWEPAGVELYDASTMQLVRRLPTGYPVSAMAFSPDGATVAVGGNSPLVVLWDSAAGRPERSLTAPSAGMVTIALAFSADGQTLYSLDSSGLLLTWNLNSGQATSVQTAPAYYSRYGGRRFGAAAISPAAGRVVVHSDAGITVSDAATGAALYSLPVSNVETLAINAQGTRLAAVADGSAAVWDLATGGRVAEFHDHTDVVSAIAFSPDGTSIASGSGDGTVRVWPVP